MPEAAAGVAAHDGAAAAAAPLLQVDNVARHFTTRQLTGHGVERSEVRALDGVSVSLSAGETLGIVGESGCGKTTLGRLVLGLLKPTSGTVLVNGQDVWRSRSPRRRRHLKVQAAFQDPYGSLNPRMKVGHAIGEIVARHHRGWSRQAITARTAELLTMVGLDAARADVYPRQLSGGQRQRVGIARAFAADPALIVADEPVSALDVSIQAQIVNLLIDLQAQTGVSYLIIAHGLAMIKNVSDRIGVLYLGKLVELGPGSGVLARPAHP
jgi:oligopeptide transport system ATP-binding protein